MERVRTNARSGSFGNAERRRQKRTDVGLTGKLFVPERNCEDDCAVIDISPDGAGIKSASSAPVGTRVVLYVECFGRFDGVIVQRNRIRLGIEFQASKVKRERTRAQIADFVAHGMVARAPLRTTVRTKELPPDYFIAEDGTKVDCEIIDIAFAGASLRTSVRPDVGKTLAFGEMPARVTRHTSEGIAVEFVARRFADQRL
jgi:hypothetical protein